MREICLATNNDHKAFELQAMLEGLFEIKTLKQIGCIEDIEETANTFQGNSLIKAQYVKAHYGLDCIADDSGLEVEALGGEPGVFSARYAGEHGNHEKNMNRLLKNLEGQSNRRAQFRTVITLILGEETHFFEGIVEGEITKEKRGNQGFGYDPLFVPKGFDRTFAEMGAEEKNPISHRGRAIEKMKAFLLSSDSNS
ncbi:non-canonical purine NTP diphosphatase [Marinilongibacter aquaticus]|uniref:non-canonical purine NTP diphosphatase n=1 Tax=Marinilongibacter aquaticus TaxID=2975157 RepID=UPI0021BDE788|nr:non-canonical purine NTP diphosphatase [Marinilongibacter aquaticus]UBM57411.1 non-canonical purine NTP diphosphatase [Marinilongibacter aquaticus]